MTSHIADLLFAPRFLESVKEAAIDAIDLAERTNTKLVIYRDNKIVFKTAQEAFAELELASAKK